VKLDRKGGEREEGRHAAKVHGLLEPRLLHSGHEAVCSPAELKRQLSF